MKKYTMYGVGYPDGPIFSGTVAALTGAAGVNVIKSSWIPTHFANDEVAVVVTYHAIWENLAGVGGNLVLWFESTWDPSIIASGDARLYRLMTVNDGGTIWVNQTTLTSSVGTGGMAGRAGRVNLGGTGISDAACPTAALPPYIRPLIGFADWSSGTCQLNIGIYGDK